jgi:nucleoside-diphosphate-sugar epimerase
MTRQAAVVEKLAKLSPGTRIAVTGATGFIGRRVVAALVAAGAGVVAIARGGHGVGPLERAGAKVVRGDLSRPETLAAALLGVSAVVHLAYDVRASGAENLAAFDGLLAAAKAAHIRRIVHVSSIVVYDGWPEANLTEESTSGGPGGGDYRQTKITMERRLADSAFEAAILQPTIVYGAGSGLWTDGPINALISGGIVLPEPVGQAPLVHADDVAEAVVRAVAAPAMGRERFIVNGPEAPGWDDYFHALARIAGKGEVTLRPHADLAARLGPEPAPGPATGPSAAARVSAALRRFIGRERFEAAVRLVRSRVAKGGPSFPERFALKLYSASPVITSARVADRLGFTPRTTLEQGLAEIERQYRS